ncbi:GNAT family N-acetyltransferase [Brucella anthropi]|jgi:putative acetyltransferase|uniref:GNAT family N-acetyltransferase n=2 Tax=Pseudomonadota TaxID=1224 RepID=A0A011VC47_BRUAN|nr:MULTISPECIES: GNAT family N-acetyltransferase [Brucella/Ochrobactrum group]MCR5939759.1 GNAT family N-acetyltransferase [Ochrobactrum sp. XJ1]QOD65549.1 GNAT family N-acetyltransferase [Ochrobactrum sp. MT180101]QTN04914.1 GNAT family N-acetyltransferase [Ochrobactrum sp. EEELCW01]EXL06025.1 acetyltransferase [Brucella anthropi]KAB2740385.1 GNAT family N-acetyltransferase [Brucella anthropi]
MAIRVSVETPLQDDVRALVEGLNAHLLPLSPLEFQFKMTVEQMAGPDTTVFVARDEDGKAVGCGALKMHEDGVGEVKRMFTLPEVRGKRVGSVLVDAIVDQARAKGISRLVLETGTGPGFAGAWRLYENSGFTRCGVVLDYPDSEYSAFFEKRLVEAH